VSAGVDGGSQAQRVGRPRATPAPDGDLTPREQILDASAALFAELGYAGTSTRAIAEQVGIRQASLYYHFAGKDDILLELLETSVRPSLAFVDILLSHEDAAAALYALASIDVGTLLATPHNIGTLYLAHEVQQPRFDSFRAHRAELQGAYTALAACLADDHEFLGACCIQLVEMVITLRRDGDLDRSTAPRIALACLRVLGLPADAVERAAAGGGALLALLRAEA
jgi:AcrR family transcriptional regulator